VRELFITNLRAILSDINREVENIVFSDKAMLLKVILDVSSPQIPIVLQTDLVAFPLKLVELKFVQYSQGDYILCMTSRYFLRSFTNVRLLCFV
jgi:hypothetical protein